jgi:hypothetical protein
MRRRRSWRRAYRRTPPAQTGTSRYRHPELDRWHLNDNPFDPTKTDTFAYIADGRGPDRQAGLEGLHRRESILVGQRRGDGVRGRLAPRGRGLRSTTAVG